MEGSYWILQNIDTLQDIKIDQPKFEAGRTPHTNIVCHSNKVSRNHACFIILQDGTLYVQDKNSSNGTYVNLKKIAANQLHRLHEGDEIGLGYHSQLNVQDDERYIFKVKKSFPGAYSNVSCSSSLSSILNITGVCLDVKKSNIPSHSPPKNSAGISDDKLNTQDLLNLLDSSEKRFPKNDSIDAIIEDIRKEGVIIKEEPVPTNIHIKPACINYQIEPDGCIIINSDDEDIQFPFSQPLTDDTNIKHTHIDDNMFSKIKKEVEELDEIDGRLLNAVVVDDSDTESDFDWLLSNVNNCNGNIPSTSKGNSTGNVIKSNNLPLEEIIYSDINKPSTSKLKSNIQTPVESMTSKNLLGKRKGNSKAPSAKRIKTNNFYNKKASEWLQKKSVTAKEKKELIDLRNKRLKEIATKAKEERTPKVKLVKYTEVKVKVSEGRGKFLTETCEVVPVNKNKKSIKSLPVQRPSNTATSINQPRNRIQANNSSTHRTVVPLQSYKNIHEIILQILQWDGNELLKSGNETLDKSNLIKMKNNFSDYNEYYNTVLPFLLLEMWSFLYKEYQLYGNRRPLVKVKIEEERKMGTYTELCCLSRNSQLVSEMFIFKPTYLLAYTTFENIDTQIKPDDIVILQYYFKNNNKFRIVPAIGYVAEANRRTLREHDTIPADLANVQTVKPDYEIRFKLLIKLFDGDAYKDKLPYFQVVTNIVTSTRVFTSLKYLEHSALCQHILTPTIQMYKVPKQTKRKLFLEKKLNKTQVGVVMEAAYMCCRNEPGIYLIQGPPGTGKTTVITNIIRQILLSQDIDKTRILVVAPSNAAVDELVRKLIDIKLKLPESERHKFKLVRLGRKDAINEQVRSYSLHVLTRTNFIRDATKTLIKDDQNKIEQLQHELSYLKASYSVMSEKQHIVTEKNAEIDSVIKRSLGHRYYDKYRDCERYMLDNAKILCTTLSSCLVPQMQKTFMRKVENQCCIIDECTQSTEQESFTPLSLGINKLVLVGDPKQLPAFTVCQEGKAYGYDLSLFSRIMSNFENKPDNPMRMLNVQYRMHPDICSLPSKMYYNNALQTDSSVFKRSSVISKCLKPYIVFSLENKITNTQEYINKSEIGCIIKILNAINCKLKDKGKFSIGIITPYNEQKQNIIGAITGKIHNPNMMMTCNTVDSFQGQEKDIIIISYVRDTSNTFVSDEHRLNVSLTRAKYALYILGSRTLFQSSNALNKIYEDAKARNMLETIDSKTNAASLLRMFC